MTINLDILFRLVLGFGGLAFAVAGLWNFDAAMFAAGAVPTCILIAGAKR